MDCGGLATIACTLAGRYWDVTCTCGFEVNNLSSREAAYDTVVWHHGDPTTPLGDAS